MQTRAVRILVRAVVVASILLAPLLFAAAPNAGAHAVVEETSPADGSVLQTSPAEVSLTFNEPVSLVPGALRVFDADKNRVDTGVASKGDAAGTIRIALKPDLADGSYAVAWRIISADSHPVHGGFVFSIDTPGAVDDLDALIDQPSQPGYDAAGALLRALSYLGSFAVVGVAVFVAFVARRHARDHAQGFRGALAACGLVAVLAQVLALPVDAALATGQGPGSLFDDGVLAQVLGAGVGLTIVGVALACATGFVAVVREGSDRRVWAVLSLVFVTLAFMVSGHTRATDPAWLMYLGDAVHVAAGAVWTGGILALGWSLHTAKRSEAPDAPELAAREVVGFSRFATVSIIAVVLAGVAMSWVEIRSVRALFSSTYGWLVVAKVGLVVILAAIGGFNHFRLVPALERRPDKGARWRYLRTTLRLEAVALVVVLGVTGVLVNTEPARNTAAMQSLFSDTVEVESGSVNVVIDPARTGPITLHVYILDPNGRPDADVQDVSVALVQPELGLGPIDVDLDHAGPGHYLINDTLFTVPGEWQVTFHVRVDEFTERSGSVEVDIGS